MKNKLIIKRLCCILLALLLLCGCIRGLSRVLCNKNSRQHFGMFYQQEENFDVLFMGSSHILNAIIPMQLWQDHGIVSYNMAFGSCRMSNCYWLARSAFEHTQPRLLVIDCAYLYEDIKSSEASRPNHMLFNTMPLGRTKLEALWDLYDSRTERMHYLFPLTEYHSRWNSLGAGDFAISYELMGQDLHFDTQAATIYIAERDDSAPADSVSWDYLEKLIMECDERGVEVLLTYIPFQAGEGSMNDMAALYSKAEGWGVNYIDPVSLLEYIDPETDYVNSSEDNSHLNYYGAVKFTDYVGGYIRDNYSVPDRRDEPEYQMWNGHYADYLLWLEEKLPGEE